MVKGAMFTIGIILAAGGAGLGLLSLLGAGMSDDVSTANETARTVSLPCGIAFLIGVGMSIGAFFV